MNQDREIDIESSRALDAPAVGPRAHGADGTDVRPVEQVVLDSDDGVVGVVGAARLRVEDAEFPRSKAAVDPSPRDDRHRRAARVEAYAPRVKQLHAAGRPQIELAARFEEELAFFGMIIEAT